MDKEAQKSWLAEFIGTFFLLFIGTGAITINSLYQNILGHLGISLAFGFIILIMIYTCGHISGAHFNPAVTLAFAYCGCFKKNQVIPYIIAQLAGAVAGSLAVALLFGFSSFKGLTLPALPGVDNGNALMVALVVEFIFTFLLMYVIMGVAVDAKAQGSFAGLVIGSTVLIGAMIAGPISGGSFNPARTLGPAIVTGQFQEVWIYLVGTILGAISGTATYKLSRKSLGGLTQTSQEI